MNITCPNCKFSFSHTTKNRSNPENRYYWGVIVELLSQELGYEREEMHEILKAIFLKEKTFLKTKAGVEEVAFARSTSELNTAEFEDYLRRIRVFASTELGIFVPLPNEAIDEKSNSLDT